MMSQLFCTSLELKYQKNEVETLAPQVYKTLRDCPKTTLQKREKMRRRVNKRERLLIL